MKFVLGVSSIFCIYSSNIAMHLEKKEIGTVMISYGDLRTIGSLISTKDGKHRQVRLDLGRHYGFGSSQNYATHIPTLEKETVGYFGDGSRYITFKTGEECKITEVPDDNLDDPNSLQMQVIASFNRMLRGYIQQQSYLRFLDLGILPSVQHTATLSLLDDLTWETSYQIVETTCCPRDRIHHKKIKNQCNDTSQFPQDALQALATVNKIIASKKTKQE